MGDPKGLEALKKKILLDHGIDEQLYVSSEECANLISEDMAEFQKPKNAQNKNSVKLNLDLFNFNKFNINA